MDGDFKTAITRDTFQPLKHFSRVLRQQGRVDLDADWNELVDILLHYQRSFTSDVIGPHAGTGMRITQRPQPKPSTIEDDDADDKRKKGKTKAQPQPQQLDVSFQFQVGVGRYYVDGILVESDRDNYFFTMLDDDRPQKNEKEPYQYLFYLDVWEREVTYLEDDSIREVALGGPDTATRTQVIWRVKVKNIKNIKGSDALLPESESYAKTGPDGSFNIAAFGRDWTHQVRTYAPDFVDTDDSPRTEGPAYMKARTLPPEEQSTSPCITPPSSQFRGLENQLYRVEIHDSGYAYQDSPPTKGGGAAEARGKARSADGGLLPQATFKWSRENGSVVFPIVGDVPTGTNITVTVESLGNDDSHSALHMDEWVEIIDAEEIIEGEPGPLFQVTNIDYSMMQVTLNATSTDGYQPDNDDVGQARHRYLRRWDYQEGDPSQNDAIHLAPTGAAKLVENRWLLLEDGVQILFHSDYDANKDADDAEGPPAYRTGNYWLIPARTATGDIEWPQHRQTHAALPPHGVTHHYAPLAFITLDNKGMIQDAQSHDLRRRIKEGWEAIAK